MDNKINGWKDIENVYIPPIEKKGFQENVVIRRKIQAITLYPEVLVVNDSEDETIPSKELMNDKRDDSEDETIKREIVCQLTLEREKTGEKILVSKSNFVIGRSKKADYALEGNPTISRTHIMITAEANAYYLKDMESENHTFVNGKILTQAVELEDGMQFEMSDEKFTAHIDIVRK